MIGEREQVKTKASAGLSFAPTLRASAPTIEIGAEFDAPTLAPRVGHRFEEMAVVPDTTGTASALPEEKDNAPREGGKGTSKQAAPAQGKQAAQAPKQRVNAIEFDVTLGLLTFTLEDGTTIQTKPTYNGEPDYGDYVLAVEDGVIPDSAIIPCKRTEDGQALKWTYPEGTTLEGVRSIELHVVGLDQPVKIVPLPVKSDDKKGGTGKADQGAEEKGKAKEGKGEGKIGGEGKKDGAPSTVTGTDPKGKPTTQPAATPSTQPSTASTTQPTTQPSTTSQPSASASTSDAEAYNDFIKTQSPELQDLLTAPGGERPTDLTKFKEVVQALQTLSPEELKLLDKATTARTNDLDLFLKTIEWFKALSPEEKKFVAMTKDEKLHAAKHQVVKACGAALEEAAAHPFRTAYQMTIGQLGTGAESWKKGNEDLEKAKQSSGDARKGYFFGGLSKRLMGVSQAALTLGLIVGAPLALLGAPALLVGALAGAGLVGIAALIAQFQSGMSHLDAAADAETLAKFDEHTKAASEEFASLTLVPIGMLLVAGLVKGFKFVKTKVQAKKDAKAAKALDVTAEETQTQVASEVAAFDAEIAPLKKPKPTVPRLAGVPDNINDIYQKQELATATEKQIVKKYTKDLIENPPKRGEPAPSWKDYNKLRGFLEVTEVAVQAFENKAEITQAVEKALTEQPGRKIAPSLEEAETKKPDTLGGGIIKGTEVLEALKAKPTNKANQSVLRVIYDIFKTQESPAAYAKTIGEIWERAKKIFETQKTRMEQTGRSPFTLAMIDLLIDKGFKIEIIKDLLPSETFNQKILEPGATLLDMAFEGARHGISPHLLQYLVLDDMLHLLEPPTTMKQFLADLAQVQGRKGLAGDIWNLLLDASPESMRSPEFIMSVLRQLIPELE